MRLPLTVPVLQVPSDGLNVTALVTYGEFFTLRLEHDDLHLMACTLMTFQLDQPYLSFVLIGQLRLVEYLFFALIILYEHVDDLLGIHVAQVCALEVLDNVLDLLGFALWKA